MTLPDSSNRPRARSDRILAAAVWTFAVVEAIGIALMLWRW